VKKMVAVVIGFIFATHVSAQCNIAAIEKQQQQLSRKVEILHGNILSFWSVAYPKGSPFPTRDGAAERRAAWNSEYRRKEGVATLNNGLGCLVFVNPSGSDDTPSLCGPVELQARLAMEALREDWENTGMADKNSMLGSIHDSIPMLWAEEKTLYCVMRPETQYIGLSDNLQNCTPKT